MVGWKKRLLYSLIWWGWIPAVYGVLYGILNGLFGGLTTTQSWDQFFMANVWSGGVLLWWWITIGLIGTIVILLLSVEVSTNFYYSSSHRPVLHDSAVAKVIAGVVAVLMIGSIVQLWRVTWDNDKDYARFYNQSVTFYTPDLHNNPASLSRLVNGARQGDDTKCDLIGSADVPSCIKQGTLPPTGWDARVGSLDGAIIALSRTSGDVQKVSLNDNTMAYLNAWHGQPARWSGILDGHGITQSLGGVAEWSGTGQPTQCLFTGQYAIDRAFSGSRSNDMSNLLAVRYPALRWNISDVWGYCDGVQPIVVVPMTKQIYFKNRTVDTAAGIVTIQGDDGKAKLTYYADVKPGQFPGPVYPLSLVATQREEASWAAGRQNQDRNGFGYDPATSDAQAGNVSEYLLRDTATGRLEYVTPLTLRHSTSELFVAYAVSYADTVSSDSLNPLSIYVLAENDPRRINIDNLEADARNYLSTQDPGFFSSKGTLVEFTPINGDVWRAFGELNGRVVYRLDISASKSVAPVLVNLDTQTSAPSSNQPSNTACGQPIAQLTPSQLTTCLQQFADELAKRQGVSSPSASPSK